MELVITALGFWEIFEDAGDTIVFLNIVVFSDVCDSIFIVCGC